MKNTYLICNRKEGQNRNRWQYFYFIFHICSPKSLVSTWKSLVNHLIDNNMNNLKRDKNRKEHYKIMRNRNLVRGSTNLSYSKLSTNWYYPKLARAPFETSKSSLCFSKMVRIHECFVNEVGNNKNRLICQSGTVHWLWRFYSWKWKSLWRT